MIPDACTAVLPYSYFAAVYNDNTTAWTTGQAFNIRVNNAYDPIIGTHQPYGWDQMAGLYRFYKVVGCTMKFTLLQSGANEAAMVFIRSVPVNENQSIASQTPGTIGEWPGTRIVPLVSGAGTPPCITHTIDIPRLLGVSHEQFNADASLYSAAVTSAPTRYAYVQLAAAGPATTTNVDFMVEVKYTVNYWQRITQAQS